LPPGRVASCSSSSIPSATNRACQRQIVGLLLAVRHWISIVPTPSALRQHDQSALTIPCFYELFPDHGFQPLPVARSKPDDAAAIENVPSCHEPGKAHDSACTRYTPSRQFFGASISVVTTG
jgi:hypothetical protein